MQKNMFKNTYKSLLYLCLLSIPLTAKPALADKNNISICQGNSQQITIYPQAGIMMLQAYDKTRDVNWLTSPASLKLNREGVSYFNLKGEEKINVFFSKDRQSCSIAIGNFLQEMGTQVISNTNNISVVRGKLSYRQRIALPVNSQIVIKLLDVSLQDSAAKVLAQQVILTKGENVPIPFQLRFNRIDIIPNHSYVVRAEIRIEDRLAFTTTRNYPVITNGAPETVDILLDPVETLGLEQQLQQGQWLLEDLGGRGVIDNLQTKLKFDSQGRISGLAGCNRYFGQYKLKGENLKMSNIASTRKACFEAVANQESLFLNALERAYQIRIDGPYLLIYSKGLKQPLKFTLLY